jgi:hypothetical protein
MPKRDKWHEEEVPKQSTMKYEGGQGEKTRARQQELREQGTPGAEGDTRETGEKGPRAYDGSVRAGGSHLDEDRQQHDEAERKSERTKGVLRRTRPDIRDDEGPGERR